MTGDVRTSLAAHDTDIAVMRRKNNRSLTRNCDVQIARNGVITGAMRICVNRDHLAVNADLRAARLIPLICLFLPVGIDALVYRNMDLTIVRNRDVNCSPLAIHMEASAPWKRLLQIIGVVIGVAAPRQPMDVWIFTKRPWVQPDHFSGNQASDYHHHHQHDPAGANAASTFSGLTGPLVFDQLDNAPHNQQHWPIIRKPLPKVAPGNDPHVAQKEENSHDDQHNRAGERTLVTWRSRGRSRRRSLC